MPGPDRSEEALRLRETLASIAPGTALRDGLERILRGRTGALIVLGYDRVVEAPDVLSALRLLNLVQRTKHALEVVDDR